MEQASQPTPNSYSRQVAGVLLDSLKSNLNLEPVLNTVRSSESRELTTLTELALLHLPLVGNAGISISVFVSYPEGQESQVGVTFYIHSGGTARMSISYEESRQVSHHKVNHRLKDLRSALKDYSKILEREFVRIGGKRSKKLDELLAQLGRAIKAIPKKMPK